MSKKIQDEILQEIAKVEALRHKPVDAITDLFKDPSIRVVGIVSDPNEGKSNVIYHIIQEIKANASQTRMYSYGLNAKFDGVLDIHTVTELETITNSLVIIDEWADFVDVENRRQSKKFEKTVRTIFHPYKNNILILCGLARNFNSKISGMLHAMIFKQTTLVDIVQRSPIYNIMKEYEGGMLVHKGSSVLSMPKNIALVHKVGGRFDEVTVPYVVDGDTKRNNPPIILWNEEIKV